MKLTPRRAHATAVLPRPTNGSIRHADPREAMQLQALLGERDGKVAGCADRDSPLLDRSYGMNHVCRGNVLRRPPPATAPVFDSSW